MAMGISKTQEGVEALRALGDALLEENENIGNMADDLQSVFDDCKGNLAKEDEIEDLIDNIRELSAGVSTSVATLSANVKKLATKLENFLNSRVGSSGN